MLQLWAQYDVSVQTVSLARQVLLVSLANRCSSLLYRVSHLIQFVPCRPNLAEQWGHVSLFEIPLDRVSPRVFCFMPLPLQPSGYGV